MKMGNYQIGRRWLSESQLVSESPENVADKAIEKAVGTRDTFLTGESVKNSKMKKLFVGDRPLDLANQAVDDLIAKQDEIGKDLTDDDGNILDPKLKKQAEAALKPARGKIFSVILNASRGKIFYDIAVIGNKAQAKKMSQIFLSALSSALSGVSLGEEKVKREGDQSKSGSELATLSDHPFLSDAWFIESEIPFTIE